METKLYNQAGEIIGSVELPDAIFGVPPNADLINQALRAYMANSRASIAHTKGRGEVRGGGKKPWRQKGTGRARHASIRSPIWKGGGVAFGPSRERNFSQKINKRMSRSALAMALSGKAKDQELFMIDSITFPEPKTKQATAMLKKFITPKDSILVVTAKKDRLVERAIRNIPRASVITAGSLNIQELLSKKYLILAQDTLPVIRATYHL